MPALIAVIIVLFLVWAKNHAMSGDPSLTAAGSLTVSASNAPTVDPNASNQGGPIGNTFLSETQTIQDPGGNVIELPFRPSAPHNGGGVVANYGLLGDNSTNSVGSGTGAIEKINAPAAASAAPPGGAARISILGNYGGRSGLWGMLPVPVLIYRSASPSPSAPAAPKPPAVVINTLPGRPAIASANTTGPRAAANTAATPPPSAAGIDLHTAPPTPPTPAQRALIRRISSLR
jgi:hypothetical protein